MDTNISDENSNSNQVPIDTQTAPAVMAASQARDAIQKLDTSVPQYLQGNQRIHENLSRLMDHPSDQIRRMAADIKENRDETKRNRDLIRSYRY